MQAGCNCIGADGLQHGWLLLQHQALRNLSYAQHVRHAVPCSSSVAPCLRRLLKLCSCFIAE